ncbi:Spermidine-binding periplasmic protein SpuE [compost metagenome]
MKNPAISFHYPKEGYGVWSDNAAVLKDAKNVDNAKLFINFVMDPENAAMNSAFHGYANGIAGPEKFMPDTMKNAPEIVIPAESREGGQLQRLCAPEAQDLYKRIWTDLRK